ncbi:type II CRISPR RNA-guided endonuclease Cas9 [Kiritimatiella glycovorans]|uniref:CRISPR-associated endonuclease Cas9 n=1 Tax=Kiritimatiella glycovorans TaxID=1307763 RepID=A0A0G3EK96_9BACT|nr:type II CRISPR RNA-guided endonuclease Cas9 [Kiritimatiella glycovorans]AKJ65240.1 CRISPR-associated endonuclease Cas9/Csn1 [Kiritimatiella glycovorans]
MSDSSYVLGLDLGTNSIGWACVRLNKGKPDGLLAQGVRIFEAGLEIDAYGRGTPLNTERRNARQRRRLHDRRKRRILKVRRILQEAGMLPANKPDHKDAEWKMLLARNPYRLRAKALDEQIDLKEIGLCIYQFAHRRGFLSNSKILKKDDDRGKLKDATKAFAEDMEQKGARTWGEYLSHLDPHEQRIRTNYTLREWYTSEFDLIWEKQQSFYPHVLTDDLYKRVKEALFYQRPLKSQAHLLGQCELEPGRKRAPFALLMAQEFRLLQSLNHLRVVSSTGDERLLTDEERKQALALLRSRGNQKFTTLRKVLNLRGTKFNLERGGEKTIQGNNTAAALGNLFGEAWDHFSSEQKNQIVEDRLTIGDTDALIRRMKKTWGLDSVTAEMFSETELEDGYCGFSRKALEKLLPLLERGHALMEAVQAAYPDYQKNLPRTDTLPPLENLRNPIVQRTLSELRRVVNAIIKEYGKSDKIRIELARDMKQTAKNREKSWDRMRVRERQRKEAAKKILEETGNPAPRRHEIEKVLLAEECNWECPYTGKRICMNTLLGDAPQFDIEHIIPFSRSFDNSFSNKTLCDVNYNRNVKGNKTPYESASETEHEEMVCRVKRFTGDYKEIKLDRFNTRETDSRADFIEEFSTSQLNDTRYASRLAGEYLGKLYGSEWRKHIQIAKGGTTKYLRDAWDLNRILSDGGTKSRDDHRHHAVDAVVVALTTPQTVKALSDANQRAPEHRRYAFSDMPLPWETFRQDVEQAINSITVSHKVCRKANGQLHKETFYGLIKDRKTGDTRTVLRKPLHELTDKEIKRAEIVDSSIRKLIEQKLKDLDQPPKTAFKDRNNHPFIIDKNGNKRFIHKVRVYQDAKPVKIAENRHVKLGGNHHLEIFEVIDKKGNPTWKCEVISLFDTRQRVKEKRPVIVRQDQNGNPLKFSLSIGEAVQLDWNGGRETAVVQKMSKTPNTVEYVFRKHNDARKAADIPYKETITVKSDSALFASNLQKIVITPTGLIRRAND